MPAWAKSWCLSVFSFVSKGYTESMHIQVVRMTLPCHQSNVNIHNHSNTHNNPRLSVCCFYDGCPRRSFSDSAWFSNLVNKHYYQTHGGTCGHTLVCVRIESSTTNTLQRSDAEWPRLPFPHCATQPPSTSETRKKARSWGPRAADRGRDSRDERPKQDAARNNATFSSRLPKPSPSPNSHSLPHARHFPRIHENPPNLPGFTDKPAENIYQGQLGIQLNHSAGMST